MVTHIVTAEGGEVAFNGVKYLSRTLPEVLKQPLLTGDVIQLVPTAAPIRAPGGISIARQPHLTGGLTIRGVADDAGRPRVRLEGEGIEITASGYRYPRGWLAFFLLENLDDIEFRDLEFDNCWPSAIFLNGCRKVRIINCRATWGTNFISADNTVDPAVTSSDFTLERIFWSQEPRLWRDEITWCQVKQDKDECTLTCKWPNRKYLNGAMFHSRNLDGDIKIRDCTVIDAFNAIRIEARENSSIAKPSNVDVRIHGNHFVRIRDNVTEPEVFALNWWIYDNRIENSYATFSFDNVEGGYWYVFANRVWISEPLIDRARCGHIEGHSYKFDTKCFPTRPWYTFHNSIFCSTPYAKEAMTWGWHSFNNAIEFTQRPNPPGTPPAYFWDSDQCFHWDPSYVFQQDLTNYPDFPDALRNHPNKYLVNGLHAHSVFANARGGDLTLVAAVGHGAAVDMPIAFANGTSTTIPGRADIGAMQGPVPYRGPEFVGYAPHPWPYPNMGA